MKAQMFKNGIIFLLFIFGLNTVKAQNNELTKDYHEEFDVTENTELVLSNKYGDVDIKDWEQNKIVIDVVVTVNHSNKATAEKMLEYINVEFSQSGDEILAKTVFDERFNKMNWSRGRNGKRFNIDYTVNMPKDVALDLQNKYGNAFISELTGEVLIQLKYGNLKANKILRGDEKPLSKVVLSYGKATIEEVNWLKLDVKYCDKLEIGKSKALMIMSGYSKVFVDEASSIVADSKYDNYTIGKVNNFVTASGYTGYKFDQVNNKLMVESKYGNCSVGYIPKTFEEIDINSKYGTIKLGIEEGASYSIKGEAGYGKIEFPSGGRVSRIINNNSTTVDGIVGTETSPKATIKIYTKYGSVHI